MDEPRADRRRFLRAAGLAAGAAVGLAGCSGPEDDGGGGVYRFEEADPQAGTGDGGSSAG